MTVGEYLYAIPDPEIRDRALANTSIEMLNSEPLSVLEQNIPACLVKAFHWKFSPEGMTYWVLVYEELYHALKMQ